MSKPLLRVEGLEVEFNLARGVLRAVDGASFEVHPGEALGIVGESGSGKTMALRALVGLLPRTARITAGTVEIDGVDVTAAGEERRRELRGRTVSMIFQEPMTALNPVMRVGDQIAETPLVRLGLSRRAAHVRALELMRLVGIPDPVRRAEAYPHELSGGMRQRVMIAIALSADPKLILCDEPTTALDVTIQDQILKLLGALQRDLGVSLVFVSHDLAVIAQTWDRAVSTRRNTPSRVSAGTSLPVRSQHEMAPMSLLTPQPWIGPVLMRVNLSTTDTGTGMSTPAHTTAPSKPRTQVRSPPALTCE